MTIDLEELAAVIRLLKEAEFSEFTYLRGDTTLEIRRGDLHMDPALGRPQESGHGQGQLVATPAAAGSAPVAPPAPPAVPKTALAVTPPDAIEGARVIAPLLGTYYSAPKPGEAPFVKIGDRVTADSVVCIVEVMKLMNSVSAGVEGIVAAIHARDGDLVEHGQALFTVVESA